MSRRLVLFTILIALFAGGIAASRASAQNPTIPTRTPTPRPVTPTRVVPPTATPVPPTSGPPPTQPAASPTPPPTAIPATATPRPQADPLATPSCGSQPFAVSLDIVNVRQGPGTDYPIAYTMSYLEEAPIVGRSGDAPWWQLQLDDGLLGWVIDSLIIVDGFSGNIPVVPAPEINGSTVTPGAPWKPTPLPYCTVTPTATATGTAEATATPTATAAAEVADAAAVSTETPASGAAEAPPTATSTPTSTAAAVGSLAEATPLPTAAPLELEQPAQTPAWPAFAGLALLAAGLWLSMSRRKAAQLK